MKNFSAKHLAVLTCISFSALGCFLMRAPSLHGETSLLSPAEIALYQRPTSSQEALQRLIEGNKRYMQDKSLCSNRSQERRTALVSKQKPFAVIMGCSDSRVAPEIIFDQGVGDLFVVRIAGNVVGALETSSIEYAIKELGAQVVIVLGHENCGAVSAVIQGQAEGMAAIGSLIEEALKDAPSGSLSLIEAVKMNAKNNAQKLKNHPKLVELIKTGKLAIVAGYYHLDSGAIELLP